jgi:hypothetical protein
MHNARNVIPQKPPPPPRRETGEPLHPSVPVEAPDYTDRPTTPADPPASQPPPAPRVQAAPRSRRGAGRLELPGQSPKPEIISRRAVLEPALMILDSRTTPTARSRSRAASYAPTTQ